jgi:hypothetical protein
LSIHHDIKIAETQNTISPCSEKGVAPNIALEIPIVKMLPTIDFDDQTELVRDEIDDIGAARRLASEARAFESMCSDCVPYLNFCVSHSSP